MKIAISRPELALLIGNIQGVVSSNPPIPILANVLIEAYNKQLTISVTNITISVCAQIEGIQIFEEGAIVLPARHFFSLIRELTLPEVTFTTSNEEIAYIEAGHSRFRLNGISKDAFPVFPDLSHENSFSIPSATLKTMFVKTLFAASRDITRPFLNGVCMRIEEDRATFIGADGKHLSKIYTPIELEEGNHRCNYFIPIKSVEEIVKVIGYEGDTKVFLAEDKIGVESDHIFLVTQLSTERYPNNVEQIIPQKGKFTFAVHREELMTLLKQVMPFAFGKNHSVLFTLNPGELTIIAQSSEVGEGKVSMSVDYSGEFFEMALNPLAFYDLLRHSDDETVFLTLTNSYTPGLITDSTTAKYVIMPMRLCSSCNDDIVG